MILLIHTDLFAFGSLLPSAALSGLQDDYQTAGWLSERAGTEERIEFSRELEATPMTFPQRATTFEKRATTFWGAEGSSEPKGEQDQ